MAFLDLENDFFVWTDLLFVNIYFYDIYSFRLFEKSKRPSKLNIYLEIIASFPWVFLFLILSQGTSKIFHSFLFLQILNIPRFWNGLNEVERYFITINPTVLRLIHLGFLSFFLAHWSGCIWFWIGKYEGFGVNFWVPSIELRTSPILSQYLFSLYWGFINSTTINWQTHYTILENVFGLIMVILGISVSAAIIGNVGSLLGNLDALATAHRQKLESLRNYMRTKQIPLEIQNRVYDYQEYLWSRQKGLNETNLFKDLPISMKTDIALYLNKEVLQKVPFLKNASENFLNVLVRVLKPEVYAPGEYIIRYGEVMNILCYFVLFKHLSLNKKKDWKRNVFY